MITKECKQIVSEIANDPWIKVAGIDADGVLRGKDIAHSKFTKAIEASTKGVGICSVVFGWDMTDEVCLSSRLEIHSLNPGRKATRQAMPIKPLLEETIHTY